MKIIGTKDELLAFKLACHKILDCTDCALYGFCKRNTNKISQGPYQVSYTDTSYQTYNVSFSYSYTNTGNVVEIINDITNKPKRRTSLSPYDLLTKAAFETVFITKENDNDH